jgi:hypothetical protein
MIEPEVRRPPLRLAPGPVRHDSETGKDMAPSQDQLQRGQVSLRRYEAWTRRGW